MKYEKSDSPVVSDSRQSCMDPDQFERTLHAQKGTDQQLVVSTTDPDCDDDGADGCIDTEYGIL